MAKGRILCPICKCGIILKYGAKGFRVIDYKRFKEVSKHGTQSEEGR